MKRAICRNMDGTRDCQTKWSKSERERQVLRSGSGVYLRQDHCQLKTFPTERERQIPCAITYMWNPNMTPMNLSMKQKPAHRLRERTGGCHGNGVVGRDTGRVWG